jgi:predicted enzyme related to lactoylglutathione lyase
MQGQFFWYDVLSADVPATAKFYGDVVGWGTQDVSTPQAPPYHLFTLDGRGVAGIVPVSPDMFKGGAKPAWLGYIQVDDVDKMVDEIEKEGGKLHRGPITVPGVLRFAVVSDPLGGVFLVATPFPVNPPPPLVPGTPGTFGWHELLSNEWPKAFAFYEKLFGWSKVQAVDMGPMGVYQTFRTGGGHAVGGMMNKPPHLPASFWSFYLNLTYLDAAIERIIRGGGKIINEPIQVPTGSWIAHASDPQGAFFAIAATQR